jgi:ribose 5-phosphate isomerase B
MIYLGADHRGYNLKEEIKKSFKLDDIEFKDLGNLNYDENDDYPDFVKKVAGEVLSNPKENKGILLCGTGIGMSIAANKFKGIRAAQCYSKVGTILSRQHNNANIICLGSRMLKYKEVFKYVMYFLNTKFEQGRHQKRVNKI